MAAKKTKRAEAVQFGEVVRRCREERGLTQDQLAERAGITGTYVGFIERGDSVPTLTVVLQIAEALKVRPAELLRDF